MIRKLLLPLIALLALSGCVSDYAYRGGSGDYYYGSPRSTYYYGAPYSSIGYGSPGGWYGGIGYGYGYGYGSPYGYGYRYGYPYYPYYPYYPRRPHYHRPPSNPPGGEHRPPQEGDRMTGGRQPPRRVMAPQPQQAGAMPPRVFRGEGGPPMTRPPREGGMPGMQDRPMRRQSSQPLAPVRAEGRPAPRMEAPAPRPVQAPRMERQEAPRRISSEQVE